MFWGESTLFFFPNRNVILPNIDSLIDYLSSNPESLYQVMRLFSDLGTPYGFRLEKSQSLR